MSPTKDFYKILGVDRKATKEQIKKAHKKMAKTYHPDVNKSPEAEKKFKEIQEAYEVLSNEETRAQYDQHGESWRDRGRAQQAGYEDFGQAGGFNFNGQSWGGTSGSTRYQTGESDYGDLFNQFFGGAASRGGPGGSGYFSTDDRFGAEQMDEEASLLLTLEEIMKGGKVRVHVQGKEIGVTLPASIVDGQRIRLKGMGGTYSNGTKGDLYVTLQLKPDPIFTVDGFNLTARLEVAPWHVALGTEAKVKLPDGGMLNVKVPAGISTGQKLRVTGKGLRKPDGFGDLYVSVQVTVPKASSEKVQQLYRELAQEQSFEPKFIG
ncbi:curved DNA-binding protein [Paenibacillus sp. 1_12]|uniref:DnaJ C-terminal domain-containing protein n=1 Tax=Paenibacillus sp. 1_12 TaxID=1566278 RepID=UPI0008F1F4F0|nr:J domain-containing protein [Paenibacillus sp. 1_12]SFK95118.1 curved DNA-binding protein [Paenibacillus sp. 1_12]